MNSKLVDQFLISIIDLKWVEASTWDPNSGKQCTIEAISSYSLAEPWMLNQNIPVCVVSPIVVV